MKRIIAFLWIVTCAIVAHSADVIGLDIKLTEAGTLAELYGEQLTQVDSVAVEGPVNGDDLKALTLGAWDGRLRVINLEKASMPDNKVPDFAFFNEERQHDFYLTVKYYSNKEIPDVEYLPLRRIILPDNITEIGVSAFAQSDIETINLPSELTTIRNCAFACCRKWKSEKLIIPSEVSNIESDAFYLCQSLTHIVLPKKVIVVESYTFSGCYALEQIELSPNLLRIGLNSFRDCSSLKSLKMPDTLEYVGWFAFRDCSSLVEVTFSQKLRTLSEYVFYGTKLTEVTLPKSLEKLGEKAFGAIPTLKSLTSPRNEPPTLFSHMYSTINPIPLSLFADGTPLDTPVYVPKGSAESYRVANGWNELTNIIETDNLGDITASVDRTAMASVDASTPVEIYTLQGLRITPEAMTSGSVYIIRRGATATKVIAQ